MEEAASRIGEIGLVPVITLSDIAQAAPLASALVAAGLYCAEVTFRTPAAEDGLREMAEHPDLLAGAGTILSVEQLDGALAAGARFVVTPGFSRTVVRACQERGVPVIPGVATPTEVQMALDEGLELVKFFPAKAAGGVAALSAISAPFTSLRFIPTGGISVNDLPRYLALPSVHAVGGSWMVAATLLAAGAYPEVTRIAAEAVETVRSARGAVPGAASRVQGESSNP